jgi:hypothetical protein
VARFEEAPSRKTPRREIVQSERWGRVEDVRDEADAQRQRALASKPDEIWKRASAAASRAGKPGSFARKMFDEEGASLLSAYILDNDMPSNADAAHILASQPSRNDRPLARGIKGVTDDEVAELLGFVPKERRPVVVEYGEGRWLEPAMSHASSWSASGEVASSFSESRGDTPASRLADKWDVVIVTEGGEEDGNFVHVDYDALLNTEHDSKEDAIYEKAFEMLVDNLPGDADDDHPYLQAEDADEIRSFDPDDLDPDDEEDAKKIKNAKAWEAAKEDLEEYYHYASERLSEEGSLRDASVYSEEEERLGVGPVRIRRAYVFPADEKLEQNGPRPSLMRELHDELVDGEISLYDADDHDDGDVDEDDYDHIHPTRMARKRPRAKGGRKKPPRIDRFMVSARDVFGSAAKKVAASWMRRRIAAGSFSQWVEGRRFKNPTTGNDVLFKSLPKPEQAKIRARWSESLAAEDDAPAPGKVKDPLFHTTSHASLEQIAEKGLVPRSGGGTFEHGGYAEHSQGKVFLSDSPEAARSWQNKVFQQLEDRHGDDRDDVSRRVPVMLRVKSRETEVDPVGDKDVPGSRITQEAVPPEDIEFWHPKNKRWEPMESWGKDTGSEHAVLERDEDGVVVDEDAFMPGDDDDYDRDWAGVREQEKRERAEKAKREREESSERSRREMEERFKKYLEPDTRRKHIERIKEHGFKSPIPGDSTKPGVFPRYWQTLLKVDERGNALPDYPFED